MLFKKSVDLRFSIKSCVVILIGYAVFKLLQFRYRKKKKEFPLTGGASIPPASDVLKRVSSSLSYDEICDVIKRDETLTFGEKENLRLEILNSGSIRVLFNFVDSNLPFYGFSSPNELRIIEEKTETQIIFPKKCATDGDKILSITGKQVEHILLAYRSLKSAFLTSRKRNTSTSQRTGQKLTHFVSIPMNFVSVQENFEEFKARVLEMCGEDRGICRELFLKKEKLHLTLGVMNLSNDAKKELAFDTLEKCKTRIINPVAGNEPIVARIRGVRCMKNNPSKANVLYGVVETNEIFQTVADETVSAFIEAGLMERERKNVLLHLTLMNSKFLRKITYKKAKLENGQLFEKTFDARRILQNFQDYEFGRVKIETMHLSQFCAVDKNGYYAPSFEIYF